MKLKDCTLGTLVKTSGEGEKKIGHIIGLAYSYDMPEHWKNDTCEVIPVVQFVGSQFPTKIHYANIERFKDY